MGSYLYNIYRVYFEAYAANFDYNKFTNDFRDNPYRYI